MTNTPDISDTTIIIPSYNPDDKLISVVSGVIAQGFTDIIVVNDGSAPQYDKYFDKILEFKDCTLLRHEINKGKGAALKTAFAHFLSHENSPDNTQKAGVITVDGDNQHLPEDIYNCAQAMLQGKNKIIFGSRDFSKAGIPARSVFGNKLTSFIFRTGCGILLSDTQTGLRAIPTKYLPAIAKVKGERFEYETNMILEIKSLNIPYKEVKIQTVYIEENASSHFRPLIDSIRIYKTISVFMLSSALSLLIDLGTFNLFCILLLPVIQNTAIIAATILARIISSLFNFFCNNKVVFKSKESKRKNFLRYYALCIPQMLVSAALVYIFAGLSDNQGSVFLSAIKIGVDAVLFFVSFKIQRDVIFRRKDTTVK